MQKRKLARLPHFHAKRNISEPVCSSTFHCVYFSRSTIQFLRSIIIVMKHLRYYVDASVNYRDWLITTSNIYFSFADARRRQGNSSVTNFVRFLAKKGLKNNPFYF